MNVYNIMQTLKKVVHGLYPLSFIYEQEVPQGFSRPSFSIKFEQNVTAEETLSTFRSSDLWSITFFGSNIEERNNDELLTVLGNIQQTFYNTLLLPVEGVVGKWVRIKHFNAHSDESNIIISISTEVKLQKDLTFAPKMANTFWRSYIK